MTYFMERIRQTEGWANKCPRKEPSYCRATFCWGIYVPNDCCTNYEERRPLESSEHSEDEICGQIRRKCCANGKGKKQRCAGNAYLRKSVLYRGAAHFSLLFVVRRLDSVVRKLLEKDP